MSAAGVKRRLACGLSSETNQMRMANVGHRLHRMRTRKPQVLCPGEPQPRKKAKKAQAGPANPPSTIINTQDELARFALGGALTFHLIESLFVLANPCIPGMSYGLFRDLLHASGGSSKEAEIAAECLCSAMIASSATFTDHPVIVGTGDVETPTEIPEGTDESKLDFEQYLPYGQRRRQAVEALARRSYALFDESGIKDRPGIETIYTLLALDQCATLTSDEGRRSRDFIQAAVDQLKHLLARAVEMSDEQKQILQGPLGRHIISLDAHVAAVLNEPALLSDNELELLLPHINVYAPPHVNIDPPTLLEPEVGWTELGKQLAPLQTAVAGLYRRFLSEKSTIALTEPSLKFLWSSIDAGSNILDSCDAHVANLPPLGSVEATAQRQFDLESLITSHRRSLLRLDLVIHQSILATAMQQQADEENIYNNDQERNDHRTQTSQQHQQDIVYLNYQTSRSRVQKVFKFVVKLAKRNVETRSLVGVRRLFETIEICTTWSSLRTADKDLATQCVVELGLNGSDVKILVKALSLAAWSSASAHRQIEGLQQGLTQQ
ncbi:hypothetical protein OIO90_000314 [Microbotryomycetes sp. JL221]|nr:hypothetical protein OIO90_000314 [Microbotryomycetes sp. JL221]